MRISLSACKQFQPLANFHVGLSAEPFFCRKEKVVVVMGATGTGKSRLAVDLATRFPAEIINSDKMQVYKGLDIVTNKITDEESRGVPHHLIGMINPDQNFSAFDFQHHASLAIQSIISRDRLPIVAGGSNSFIEALVTGTPEFRLRYECCFLWVDVSLPVLRSVVFNRVDKMVEAGMVDEVGQLFDPDTNYSVGIRRAIGVPELDSYFRSEELSGERSLEELLKLAIWEIKLNTYKLAFRQLKKINRLRSMWSWDLNRVDATRAFEEGDEAWERLVVEPTAMIVERFLCDDAVAIVGDDSVVSAAMSAQQVPLAAVAAAGR